MSSSPSSYDSDSDDGGEMSVASGYCSDASEIRRMQEQIQQQERASLRSKIKRLSEQTGIKCIVIRNTLTIDDLQAEVKRITDEHTLMRSIKFQRRLLLTFTSGVEFIHNKTPLAGKLDGWGDSMMASLDDYDRVFERLHEKHAPRHGVDGKPTKPMEPEVELLYLLGYSAFSYGVTSSIAHLTMSQAKQAMHQAQVRTANAARDTKKFEEATSQPRIDVGAFAQRVADTIPETPATATASDVKGPAKKKVTLNFA